MKNSFSPLTFDRQITQNPFKRVFNIVFQALSDALAKISNISIIEISRFFIDLKQTSIMTLWKKLTMESGQNLVFFHVIINKLEIFHNQSLYRV